MSDMLDARGVIGYRGSLDYARQAQAVLPLLRIFNFLMPRANTPYTQELQIVRDIADRMEPPRRAAWLAELRATYKAKRNFVRDLPQ